MERKFSNFFGLLGEKALPKERTSTVTAFEQTREGQPKAYIPNFFYKPPFGYPRYKDLNYYRKLAASIYVDMCETAIIDEVTSIPWMIVAEDRAGNEIPGKEKEVEIVESFFDNPNTNKESWEHIVRMMLPDLLELNSGVMVKTFDSFGKFVEIVARDGIAFTKNPDRFGMYTDRADLILLREIREPDKNQVVAENQYSLGGTISPDQAREDAAYFQYGFNSAQQPVPFGKRELVWFEKKVRTDDLYGRSAMEVLAKTVQTLIYAVEHNLEYFSDNSIPPGVLGLDGMKTDDMKAFATQWVNSQQKVDSLGTWKKAFHKLAIVNKMPKFERLGFTNEELELIESQKWWSKMVWAAFGITATELGFTEDAKGGANQIVQTAIAKKRIIYPLLRLIEYHVNTEIIPEFGFKGIKYKYKVFDVDDETKKWGLYDLQVKSGLKTVNEIRNTEGLDPLEGGDETEAMRSDRQQTADRDSTISLQQEADKINRDGKNELDRMSNKPKDEKKEYDEYDHFECDCGTGLKVKPSGQGKETNKLKKSIDKLLKENKAKIFELLDAQTKKEPLTEIKGIDDVPKMVNKFFTAFSLKEISDAIIKEEYDGGWESSEKKIDENVPYNEKALEFLQDHTFSNIKGMTEEIANDLKAELERGIINGEGIDKLKERVSKVFDVGSNRAEMIARTETNRADNQGKLLAIKGSTVEDDYLKKWITHEDDRTSPICSRLDGQTVGINESFHDTKASWEGTAPPSHINCRSTIIFIDKDEE